MEENMRKFDIKMKKLEQMTSYSSTNLKDNININKKNCDANYSYTTCNNHDDRINNTLNLYNSYNMNSTITENKRLQVNKGEDTEDLIKDKKNRHNLEHNPSLNNVSNDVAKNMYNYDSEYNLDLVVNKKEEKFQKGYETITKNEEIKSLQNIVENLKSKLEDVKSNLIKREEDVLLYKMKLNEIENDKSKLETKNSADEKQMKNLKNEYIIMTKNFQLQKKQIENLTNKLEESKRENYNIFQENVELKKKLNLLEKKSNINFNTVSREKLEDNQKNFYTTNKKVEKENYFPSEANYKENINEFAFYEEKLSALLKQKLVTENELFKFSDKPRTLNEINKKKDTEETLTQIENQIAEVKLRLRKLNGKNLKVSLSEK